MLTHCWIYISVDLLVLIPQSRTYSLPQPSHRHVYAVAEQRSEKQAATKVNPRETATSWRTHFP